MLKQPVGLKLYTNVSVVKLKLGKSRFEIACYKNKVQDWRDKKETDIKEVLQVNSIFNNAIKGNVASKKELKDVFQDMSHEEIIKLILDKGEIQVGDKERTTTTSNLRNDIANIIVEKTYNTETGLPFPQSMIIQCWEEIEFKILEGQDAKKQALKAIKEIKEKKILPLDRSMIQLSVSIKNKEKLQEEAVFKEICDKFIKELKDNESEIIENNSKSVEEFQIKCNIKPHFYRDLLNKFDIYFTFLILSSSQINQVWTKSNETDANKFNKNSEDIKEDMKTLKISSPNVDKYLNDNYSNEEAGNDRAKKDAKKPKKMLTCTKCKGSSFNDQDELRAHSKSNWHKFNAWQSAKSKESYSAEEYDEYVLMNPEAIK